MTGTPPTGGRARAVTGVVLAGISLAFVVLLARVAQLQLSPDARLVAEMTPRESVRREPALRGDLLDRNGRVLASTRLGTRVVVDPVNLNPETLDADIVRLADAMELPPDEVGTRIVTAIDKNRERTGLPGERGKVRYLPIGSVLNESQAAAVRDLKLRGVMLERRQVRTYAGGPESAAIVGKVGFEETGLMGAERLLENDLAGDAGSIRFVRDASGRPLWMNPGSVDPPTSGADVRLSIDIELQRIAHEELARRVEEMDAAGGRLVMADPTTGEILAMVDIVREMPGLRPFPWIDVTPQAPPARGQRRVRPPPDPPLPEARYVTIPDDPGRRVHPSLARNRCIEDIYEPGSTFKPFVWATVTELGRARLDEVFDTHDGSWVVPGIGRPVFDVTKRPEMTWRDVLVLSSNIGMIQGAARLTPEELHDCVKRFGFGSPTGIGLPGRAFPGEATGLVTPLSRWTKYTHSSVPWGHEVGVTPVQMVRAFSAFARSGEKAGTLPRLRLSAPSTGEPEGVTYRVLPADLALMTRDIMRDVVTNMERGMTVRQEEIPKGGWRYSMFGKSGTADIPIGKAPAGKRPPRTAKGFYPGQLNSSFIAGAPAENPRIVVIVVIDDPGPKPDRRQMYGSAAAGPAVRRVVDRALTYLGVPASPTGEPVAQAAGASGAAGAR
ncbi:MAG: penicillin-binding protein 2 [Planctomycetota bacterium]|nr:penicillin-binding protein 2 [Planctomycetota bacterium]